MYNLQARHMSDQNRVLTAEANPNLEKLATSTPYGTCYVYEESFAFKPMRNKRHQKFKIC